MRTTTLPLTPSRTGLLVAGALLALALLVGVTAGPALADDVAGGSVVLAAEERERIPIAPTPRSQLALVLYGVMGLLTAAGLVTLRRQLKGERPQSDGEFRWR